MRKKNNRGVQRFGPLELTSTDAKKAQRQHDLEYDKSNVKNVTCGRWPDVCVFEDCVCLRWPNQEVDIPGYARPGKAQIRPYVCPYLLINKKVKT